MLLDVPQLIFSPSKPATHLCFQSPLSMEFSLLLVYANPIAIRTIATNIATNDIRYRPSGDRIMKSELTKSITPIKIRTKPKRDRSIVTSFLVKTLRNSSKYVVEKNKQIGGFHPKR
jgi:hypothetical protein